MQVDLKALQPQLVATVGDVEKLMARIAHQKKNEVEPKAAIVREEEKKAQDKADAAKAIKDECEADLSQVSPENRSASKNMLKTKQHKAMTCLLRC